MCPLFRFGEIKLCVDPRVSDNKNEIVSREIEMSDSLRLHLQVEIRQCLERGVCGCRFPVPLPKLEAKFLFVMLWRSRNYQERVQVAVELNVANPQTFKRKLNRTRVGYLQVVG